MIHLVWIVGDRSARAAEGKVWAESAQTGLTLLLGNLVILVMEAMVVSIQTTRLVLFEFFTRFLTGAGRVFVPLPHLTEHTLSRPTRHRRGVLVGLFVCLCQPTDRRSANAHHSLHSPHLQAIGATGAALVVGFVVVLVVPDGGLLFVASHLNEHGTSRCSGSVHRNELEPRCCRIVPFSSHFSALHSDTGIQSPYLQLAGGHGSP